jgi:hypothetical protein
MSQLANKRQGIYPWVAVLVLLSKCKVTVVAEYAMRDPSRPNGVAQNQLLEAQPADLQSSLPSIEAIGRALAGDRGSEEA